MWKQVKTQKDIDEMLLECRGFHDCCLYNLQYVSGAYVDETGSMYPMNSKRTITLQLHQQGGSPKTIELQFNGLCTMVLSPTSLDFTCELLEAYVVLHNEKVFWMSDSSEVTDTDQRVYICAEELSWRRKRQEAEK